VSVIRNCSRAVAAGFVASAFCILAALPASARYTALYDFGASFDDGAFPLGLVENQDSQFFGTTAFGGYRGGGTFFEIKDVSRRHHKYATLFEFCSRQYCKNGSKPAGSLIVDASGNFYGVMSSGGRQAGGTIFELSRKKGQWKLKTVYNFCQSEGCPDGREPLAGLTYQGQQSGASYDGISPLFGTTYSGGANGLGVAYELTPESGNWAYQAIYSFCSARGCADGASTEAPLIEDASGNLYGTTQSGGAKNVGTAFELSFAGGAWSETVLHSFCAKKECTDGSVPTAGLTLDPSGNLYGLASTGGDLSCSLGLPHGCGVAFMLSPSGSSWQETVLHTFCQKTGCPDGALSSGEPSTSLLYANGSVIGAAYDGGTQERGGTLFELNGSQFLVLYRFCKSGSCSNGSGPVGPLVSDLSGGLFGVANGGGTHSEGVIYRLVP
jgi:uncharacterized repeat protein (TIGR03803 family)